MPIYRTVQEVAAEAVRAGVSATDRHGRQRTAKEIAGEYDRQCRRRDKRTDWREKK